MIKYIANWFIALLIVTVVFLSWTGYTFWAGNDNILFTFLDISSVSVQDLTSAAGLITGLFSAVALGLAVWAIILQKQSIQTGTDSMQMERLMVNLEENISLLSNKQDLMKRNIAYVRSFVTSCICDSDYTVSRIVIDENPTAAKFRGKWILAQIDSKKASKFRGATVERLVIALNEMEELFERGINIFESLLAHQDRLADLTPAETSSSDLKLLTARVRKDLYAARTLASFDLSDLHSLAIDIQAYHPTGECLEEVKSSLASIERLIKTKFDETKSLSERDLVLFKDDLASHYSKISSVSKRLLKSAWKDSRMQIELIINQIHANIHPERNSRKDHAGLPYMQEALMSKRHEETIKRIEHIQQERKNLKSTVNPTNNPFIIEDSYDGSETLIHASDEVKFLFGYDTGLYDKFLVNQIENGGYELSDGSNALEDIDLFLNDHRRELYNEFIEYVDRYLSEDVEDTIEEIVSWDISSGLQDYERIRDPYKFN